MVHYLLIAIAITVGCGGKKKRDKEAEVAEFPQLVQSRSFSEGAANIPQVVRENKFDVGGGLTFTLPDGMHVTQYSTDITFNGLSDVYRIAQGQDSRYLGEYPGAEVRDDGCARSRNEKIQVAAPSGKVFTYCRSALSPDNFKELFGFAYSRKHIEVLSDEGEHPRMLLLQVFDRTDQYAPVRNRFHQLCSKARDPVRSIFPDQNLFSGYWDDEKAVGTIGVCTLTASGFGTSSLWKVVGFVFPVGLTTGTVDPDWSIEAVLAIKMNEHLSQDWQAARYFQKFMVANLEESNPF